MEKRNEPLLLRPAGKDYLWGGKRLNDEYGKNIELSPLAETWECSTHPDGVSTVCCGTFDKMELTAVIKAHPEYLGERHKGETTLPILVKLTYRLYDYDRIGKDGKKRELHIDKALDVADLHGSAEPRQPLRVLKYRPGMASELLIRCKYFEVYRMLINGVCQEVQR